MRDETLHDPHRRGLLKCMGWAGTGLVFTLNGGAFAATTLQTPGASQAFSFVQISDTHIGFSKPANPDVTATLRETMAKIRALPTAPDLILHTGDITHLATEAQFAQAQDLLSELKIPMVFVPGEHDIVNGSDSGPFRARFAKDGKGDGWFSFDLNGVHFVALVNVIQFVDSGQGALAAAQLAWLKDDLAGVSDSTPIVVMSHFPLWPLYPQWGWATRDGAEALSLLRRFGSVTALNGHIHQVQTFAEGAIRFHAARSTAFPQPAPGVGLGPGPLVTPADKLRDFIGYREVSVALGDGPLAVADRALG